jgi:DNA-binding Lrp family transcriptional regulator
MHGSSRDRLRNPFSHARLYFKQEGHHVPTAFVLINAEIGSEDEVLKQLKSVSNVKEAYVVYGVYDIVAKVEAETMDKLKEIVTWKIRRLDKVRSTLTMIVVEST